MKLDAIAILADLMLESRLPPDRIRPLVESLQRREPGGSALGDIRGAPGTAG